uniref:Uncharacterized protein n=2 Tax=Cryptomonas curvata TaxID=233186 RepID=A0A7S0M9U5_9CRYP|mmetsp:Transcript_31149/g.65269  ORF Transcript_31149/g.65269 Transcript_31149/m.65269 type:complete len:315 (+) Transcript_31149:756-1700(+)
MIHYVGGEEDEDEWINMNSTRLRPPQDPKVASLSSPVGAKKQRSSARSSNKGRALPVVVENTAGQDAAVQRPMRRSRMLSDDARLALALQEEELRASRSRFGGGESIGSGGGSRGVHASSSQAHKRISTTGADIQPHAKPLSTNSSALLDFHVKAASASAELGLKPKIRKLTNDTCVEKVTVIRPPPRAPAQKQSLNSSSTTSRRNLANSGKVPAGCVCIFLEPDESVPLEMTLPSLRLNQITTTEDATVLQIRRQILDEICPGLTAAEIEIRTPSGMRVGPEHSIQFVRTVMWPKSMGDFVLKYSRRSNDRLL